MRLHVREMVIEDIASVVDYFVNADESYLRGMGADKSKLPKRDEWINKLKDELAKPHNQKEYYYILWLIDGNAVGHSNINSIEYGYHAKMHLHLWQKTNRANGLGFRFLKMSIPYYFQNFKLKTLVCEPYAENPAPARILEKIGFSFIKTYETIPGWINFSQNVSRYELKLNDSDLGVF